MALRRRGDYPFALNSTSSTLLFTFRKNLTAGGAIIRNLIIVNHDTTSPDDFYVYFVPPGESTSERFLIFRGVIAQKTTVNVLGPWFGGSEWAVRGGTGSISTATMWVTSAEEFVSAA